MDRSTRGASELSAALRVGLFAEPMPLTVVRPEGIHSGFGQGTARVFANSELVAVGSQSMVMNNWDWRLPSERQ